MTPQYSIRLGLEKCRSETTGPLLLAEPNTTSSQDRQPSIRSPMPSTPPHPCVVIVPSGKVVDRVFEEALTDLNQRGYPIRRVRQEEPPPGFRDRMVADALAAGFAEFLCLDPAVIFIPGDVERLRRHNLPFVCGLYPLAGVQGLACEFQPGTTTVRFGHEGGVMPIQSSGLGFTLVRREVFEAIAARHSSAAAAFFATSGVGGGAVGRAVEDVAFCARARKCGFEIIADTSIRLWRVAPSRVSWEDAGGDRARLDDFTLQVRQTGPQQPIETASSPATSTVSTAASPNPEPARNRLRSRAAILPSGFPHIRMYVITYGSNSASLAATLVSIRASDWGEEPVIMMQPDDWPRSRESGSRNYKRALERAVDDGCDFALVLEDDVRVNRHLRHNLLTNPLVRRDQCDYFSLFLPDLIADPWRRSEPHLGYRLAKPRYTGPNVVWERGRVWGAQGCLLSRRFLHAVLKRWERLVEGQDTRLISVCAEFQLPLWYTAPCLVEHAPRESAFGTPIAYASDFDPDFRLEPGTGFQPPEEVPGWLTLPEAELLWQKAADQDVLELGTAYGRSTVCLAQKARRVVTVAYADQSEANEWVRRFGSQDRVEFQRGDPQEVCSQLTGRFGLAFINLLHDAASVTRSIASVLPLLKPNGLLAFHDYPDPVWPQVRHVVDEHVRRLGWKRVAQAGFLGVFRT